MSTALAGIRVIDISQAMAGPWCTMMLGDLGADVIKVEQPGSGDQSRGWGPPFCDGESTYFLSVNRNKKSLTLNLKTQTGQEILHQLIKNADIFVCNIPREESRQRAGIDYATLHALNPRLIYCSISGYGSDGPYAGRPGYDMIAQGESGLMPLSGHPGDEPMRYPIPIADMSTGTYSVIGILSALLSRAQSGAGQYVDLSLLECQSSWLAILASGLLNGSKTPTQQGNQHPSIVPYQVFKTADGYLNLAVGTEKLWANFCDVMGLNTLQNEARFFTNADRLKNRTALISILEATFIQKNTTHWINLLVDTGIPVGPVNSITETLRHPQLEARNFIVEQEHSHAGNVLSLANPVKLSETPATYRLPPPALGEHTWALLQELGYTKTNLEELQKSGII